jgi:hypothetical protein
VIDPGQLEAICAWTDQAGEELLGRKDSGNPTAHQENEAGETEND